MRERKSRKRKGKMVSFKIKKLGKVILLARQTMDS